MVTQSPLSPVDRQLMWDGMAVQPILTRDETMEMLRQAGFEAVKIEDVSAWWAEILTERLAMYQKMRGETEAAAAPSGHDAFYASYVRFVELMQNGGLGGGRFVGVKPRV